MELSTCCDSPKWINTDICQDCKEHADFYDDEEMSEEDQAKEIAYWKPLYEGEKVAGLV